MLKHSSHGNRGADLARKCALRLYRRSSLADDQICAFETVFADGPRLIGAVDALGRVARGENGPRCDKQKTAGSSERQHDVFHCDPAGLDYDQINNRAQSRPRTPR